MRKPYMLPLRLLAVALAMSPLLFCQSDEFHYSISRNDSLGKRTELLAFRPESSMLAVGTASGEVLLLDSAASGSAPTTISKHKSKIVGLAFSRDGSLLITGSEDGAVHIASIAAAYTQVSEFQVRHKLRSLALSPNKEFLATAAGDDSIIVWDPKTSTEMFTLPHPNIKKGFKTLSFAQGGNSLVGVTEQGVICEWDIKTRALLRQTQDADDRIYAAAMGDSSKLLSVSTEISAMNKSALASGGTGNAPVGLGNRPSFGGGGLGTAHPTDLYVEDRIKIYDLDSGSTAKTLDGINGRVVALANSPDDAFVAFFRQMTKNSFVEVYNLKRGVSDSSIPVQNEGTAIAFSPDGHWLAAGNDHGDVTVYAINGVQRSSANPTSLRGIKIAITSKSSEPLIAPTEPLRIAVLNLEADPADLGRTVTDLLRDRISGSHNVVLVERQQLDKIIKEQNLQQSDRIDPLTAVTIGKGLGVRKVILGTVGKLGTTVTISVRMIDVETLKNDGERQVVCTKCQPEDLPEVVAVLGKALVKD